MVGNRRDQDSENDRQRPQKARRKHEGEDLGLVADLGDTDNRGRNKKGFHDNVPGGWAKRNFGMAPAPNPVAGPMPKVSPSHSGRLCHGVDAKHVDTDPARGGRLLPNDAGAFIRAPSTGQEPKTYAPSRRSVVSGLRTAYQF